MRVETDFLVLGSGIAGLSFALKAAEVGQVAVVTKAGRGQGATRHAQGGIASVFSENDSFESHVKDTLEAGAGLCDSRIVELTVREGPARVRELIELGVPFSKAPEGAYDLTREGGHSARRILHADDFTGQAIEDTLLRAAAAHPSIRFHEHHAAIDLITSTSRGLGKKGASASPRCLGVYVLDATRQEIHTFRASFTVLATGGAGKVYLYTTNPDTATGDGIAMAHRAGARVANMEFMQFHPTCLYSPKAKSFLISEALRGEGGELVDGAGKAFMGRYHERGSLAPRDIVARAIDTEMKRTGAECVYLDMRAKDAAFLRARFPNIFERCLSFGIDLTQEPIPVVPAAHYTCGGVLTDEWAESSIENLFAIGEVACTGLHGANRLASNSLLEGVVFADRAARCARGRLDSAKDLGRLRIPEPLPEWDFGLAVPMEERINIDHTWRELRQLMSNYVGIVRSKSRLEKARARLALIRQDAREYYWNHLLTADLIELRNLVTVAELIVESAVLRKESRGLHYSLDHPRTDDRFYGRNTVL